jgi:hypothetical protein
MASEHEEQASLIKWFDITQKHLKCRLFAIPNGGQRHILVASKLKAEGVRRGVPDLMLPVKNRDYCGLFIEMKAKKGKATPEQLEWIYYLNSAGYFALVCYGLDEAKMAILTYLANDW